MEKEKTFLTWVKNHKTELILVGVTVVGTIIVVKNWNAIKTTFKVRDSSVPELPNTTPVIENIIIPVLSPEILDNLTGTKLTARALGNKVWCSAQEINKRIVASGLAKKLPNGEYMMTEAGRLLGTDTWKTTASGHSFSNIEWDEKILDIIFSPEELLAIANYQERAQQILAA